MSTFLQLVGRLHTELRGAGVAPASVVSQRGEAKRLVEWIQKADLWIQNSKQNWKFLRHPTGYSQVLMVDEPDYSAPVGLGTWDEDTFKILEVGMTIAQPIEVVEYEYVKHEVLETNSGFPSRVIIMPDNSLKLDPPPSAAHMLTADYFRTPTELAANGDISAVPERFHEAIVAQALIQYGFTENAPEIIQKGERIWQMYGVPLENNQLPARFGSQARTGGHFQVEVE